MKIRLALMFVIGTVLLQYGMLGAQEQSAQKRQMPAVRTMNITGEIAKADQGYIIRGKKPAEIFTILNPDPARLDEFIKTGKTVQIQVRIVSGDNVEIEKIDGKAYAAAGQREKKKAPAPK